jgi:hypothetical protein
LDQSAFSLSETRFKGHLTLPKIQVEAATAPDTGAIYDLTELAGRLYGTLNNGTDIYEWRADLDSWSGKLHSLPATKSSTDALSFRLAGTLYMAFAYLDGYAYSSDGSNWVNDSTSSTKYLAFWDDRLWGISNGGQLWFSTAIGTEVNDALLALPWGGAVKALFTGPDAAGENILYAATSVGLYAHDAANARFVETAVRFPANAGSSGGAAAGEGAATWNADIYISPGKSAVYRYDPRAGVIGLVGLDRGQGLPSTFADEISRLIPVQTGLLAVLVGSGTDSVWEYNGKGWHLVFLSDGSLAGAHVTNLSDQQFRIYLSEGTGDVGLLNYRELDFGFVNPDVATIVYEGTNDVATHFTPWFNAGQNDVDKTAIRGRIDCTGMSANETVKIEFGLDYSSSFEASSITVIADGVTTFTFPTIANNSVEAGSAFRAIRFKLTLNRGGTTTNTPNVKSLSLEWRRKIPAKYGFSFDVDRTEDYGGRTPQEMKADLITAVESSTLVEFTFVTDTGNTQNYYVDVTQMEDIQDTGQNGEKGATRITVIET